MSQRSRESAALLAMLLGTPGCLQPYLIESQHFDRARRADLATQRRLAVKAWPVEPGQPRYLRYSKVQENLDGGRGGPGWTLVKAPSSGRPLRIAGSILVGVGVALVAIGVPVRGVTVTRTSWSCYVPPCPPTTTYEEPVGVPLSNGILTLGGGVFAVGVPLLITGIVADPQVEPGRVGWYYLPRLDPRYY